MRLSLWQAISVAVMNSLCAVSLVLQQSLVHMLRVFLVPQIGGAGWIYNPSLVRHWWHWWCVDLVWVAIFSDFCCYCHHAVSLRPDETSLYAAKACHLSKYFLSLTTIRTFVLVIHNIKQNGKYITISINWKKPYQSPIFHSAFQS